MTKEPIFALRCKLCGIDLQGTHYSGRCTKCNYPDLEHISLAPDDYCQKFGHDGGEVRLEETKRFEREVERSLRLAESRAGAIHHYVKIHSYVFHFRCGRCGLEKKERKDVEDNFWDGRPG